MYSWYIIYILKGYLPSCRTCYNINSTRMYHNIQQWLYHNIILIVRVGNESSCPFGISLHDDTVSITLMASTQNKSLPWWLYRSGVPYPSMEQSWIINASANDAAGERVLSSAYLFGSPTIGAIACLVAFSISLFGTIALKMRQLNKYYLCDL